MHNLYLYRAKASGGQARIKVPSASASVRDESRRRGAVDEGIVWGDSYSYGYNCARRQAPGARQAAAATHAREDRSQTLVDCAPPDTSMEP